MNPNDFKMLPKYIAYRAALLREKLVLSYILIGVSTAFALYFIISRIEIYAMNERLRKKEYILAPGVMDFTPASAEVVPDSYVQSAVKDFISMLGNVNNGNIMEQYESLKKFMSPELQIQFDGDTAAWIDQVRTEGLAQILRVKSSEVISNGQGSYQVHVLCRADYYAVTEYLGNEDQVVDMELKLIAPTRDSRWFLQIVKISWNKLERIKAKEKITNTGDNL